MVVEELRREVTADAAAKFVIDAVPPGTYHLSVRAPGYSARRTEVVVARQPLTVDLSIDPELHYAGGRLGRAHRAQRVRVVSADVGACGPGPDQGPVRVAGRHAGRISRASPTGRWVQRPPRPVIRGLDGDRVAILEDGQRMGDLSSQSADHGVTMNPAAAHKIEVVRGPATLLYGANAIGGLVNVINEQIPTAPAQRLRGRLSSPTSARARAKAASPATCSGATTAGPLHAGGTARGNGDVRTPDGDIDNSQGARRVGGRRAVVDARRSTTSAAATATTT